MSCQGQKPPRQQLHKEAPRYVFVFKVTKQVSRLSLHDSDLKVISLDLDLQSKNIKTSSNHKLRSRMRTEGMPPKRLQRKSPLVPDRKNSLDISDVYDESQMLNPSPTRLSNSDQSKSVLQEKDGDLELNATDDSTVLLPKIAVTGNISDDSSIANLLNGQVHEEKWEAGPELPPKERLSTPALHSSRVISQNHQEESLPRPFSDVVRAHALDSSSRLSKFIGTSSSDQSELDPEILSTTKLDRAPINNPNEEVEHLLKQLVETTLKLEASWTHCEVLTDEVKKLRKDLGDAHDFIFTLQPPRRLITAPEATTEFKALCVMVEEWVQTKLGDVLEEPVSKDLVAKPDSVEKLMSWITPQGREALHIPGTDEYNVMAVIMNFLCREIFDLTFWCPIEPGALIFLDSIESGMRSLQPPRDFVNVRTWRSETLTSLANRPDFSLRRQQRVKELTINLKVILKVFLPNADNKELCESLQEHIIDPATHLAHKFHLSIDKFEVEWTDLPPAAIKNGDISVYECQNLLASGRILKFPAANTRNNTYIMDVFPGLHHHAVKANAYDEPQVLKKPRILVASTKMEEGEYKNPGRYQTVLGWLEQSRGSKKHFGSWPSG